jgi:hypothetical protein
VVQQLQVGDFYNLPLAMSFTEKSITNLLKMSFKNLTINKNENFWPRLKEHGAEL